MTRTLLVASTLALTAAVALADTAQRKPAGLQMTLPEGWKVLENKESFGIQTDDPAFAVVGVELADFTADDLKAVKKSPEKLIEKLDNKLKKIKSTEEPAEVKKHGLKQTRFQGTAELKNKEVGWHLTLVEGDKQPFVLIGFGNLDDNDDELIELLDSIKKLE